jgi:4-hydroxy-4-methyl-2-oxoglutarate aldolase
VLGGVPISPGDILVGDRDGVVVVPLGEAPAVLAKLGQVKAAEASLDALVRGGLEVPDFVTAIVESDRVEEIA